FTLGLIDPLITVGTLTTGGSGPAMLSKAPPTTLNSVKNVIKEGVESTKPALKELKYQLKRGLDLDWRGTGKTWKDALDEAFKKTGYSKEDFEVTKWSDFKDEFGKSVPVEWEGPNGASINIDYAHTNQGLSPDAPHIGWQVGKGKEKKVGHIIVDDIPAGRSNKKN
ncbi:MAG: polymorphic toxin type 47 domain-containing protein, partial [Salinivirgaceae bacterium]|nr:polymorphic toxin type 47 domain-containing protein [Salinivirgaceae bacterium]